MPLDRSDIEKALKAKGFILRDRPGDDHRYYDYNTKAGLKSTVFTKVSLGSKYKTLDDSLVAKMAKQLKLSKREFENYVQCTLTHDQYDAKIDQLESE